jgi:hypothetical protein
MGGLYRKPIVYVSEMRWGELEVKLVDRLLISHQYVGCISTWIRGFFHAAVEYCP